jgi:dephospho-CoA kinase
MHIIGLLGGIASGKSLVARQLAALGAGVLDADRSAHEVLRQPEVEAAVRSRWGGGVFGADGHIDRSRLAKIVFAPGSEGAQERKYLEELTHPRIGQLIASQAEALATAGTSAAVLDAPLILEAAWDKLCDRLVYVDAPLSARQARATARGWTLAEFTAREAAQLPPEVKRRRAHAVIDNSGSPQETQQQVERFWRSLSG